MRELLKAQEDQYVDAISGTGDVSFSPEFNYLAIDDDYFTSTSMPQRQLKEVLLCPLESVEITEEPLPLSTSSLDSVSLCHLPKWIPETTCLRLSSDANRIFSENKVRRSFHSEKEFEVPKDHTNYPQKLTVTKSGLVQCEKKECLEYSTYNICRHSLDVSAFTNTLPVLLSEAGKAKNGKINLLQLANYQVPVRRQDIRRSERVQNFPTASLHLKELFYLQICCLPTHQCLAQHHFHRLRCLAHHQFR